MFNIKARRKELGYSQKEIADYIGVASTTVLRWERGDTKNMQIGVVKKLAQILNVDPLDILGVSDLPSDDLVVVDHLAHVSAGYGTIGDEDILERESVPLSYLKGYPVKEVKMLTVKGDSMYPKFIDGDKVLIHLQTSIDSGEIAVFQYDDEEVTMKKIEYNNEEIRLIPFNPEYTTKVLRGEDLAKCHVIGKVIYMMRNV